MSFPIKNGEVLHGRYQVREGIGQGGMGSIYLAEDLRLSGRLCALKEVLYDLNLPAKVLKQAREQFFREATVLARLDHPNLPKVSDFFSSGQRDYLVMDYIPGEDLRTLMLDARRQKNFLPEKNVLNWANQLADALSFMHTQDPAIVHRDIKPSNLKITPNGLLKLVDFGLVKIMVPDEITITIIQGKGTALYTPLEQYGGDDIHTDVRADVYAFGATLYHLMTNEAPADAHKRFLEPDSLPPIRQINPAVKSRTERAVLWAMSLHPDERPDSIEIFRQALQGSHEPPSLPTAVSGSQMEASILDTFTSRPDSILVLVASGLFLLGLVATLIR